MAEKIFRVRVSWTVDAEFEVEGCDSEAQAREKVYDMDLKDAKSPEYRDDSFKVEEVMLAGVLW